MTIPANSPPPPPYYYPPRSGCGSGCLWGCLALVLLVSLPVIVAGGFGAWWWTHGYRREPAFRLAMQLVRHDSLAHQVMGDAIVVAGIEGNNFSWMPGASHHDYELTLEGDKGEGHLVVTSHADSSG